MRPGQPSILCISVALFALCPLTFIGCGGAKTQFLAVADGENRVLMYSAPFSTGQVGSVVLWGVSGVRGLAADADGNLYVAGSDGVTQLRPPFHEAMTMPDVLLAVQDFNAPPSQTTVGPTTNVTLDNSSNLWVADAQNNRILHFKRPFSAGMAASLVIGQVDFKHGEGLTGGTCQPPAASTVCIPFGSAFDHAGNLWVADTGHNRVLEFRPPFTNGMSASVVLGQTGFTSFGITTGNPDATMMNAPTSLVFDRQDNLWVADTAYNRVLQFKPPFFNGMAASLVLGQVAFGRCQINQDLPAPTSATLANPSAMIFDHRGRLIVADRLNNRVVVFAPPFSNGMQATTVLGQSDFTHNEYVFGPGTLAFPSAVSTF